MNTLDNLLDKHGPRMTADDFRAACSGPLAAPRFDLFAYLLEKYGPMMTAKHVGEVTHHSESHIRALCQSGELPAVRIGNRWHIPTVKLAAILEGGE